MDNSATHEQQRLSYCMDAIRYWFSVNTFSPVWMYKNLRQRFVGYTVAIGLEVAIVAIVAQLIKAVPTFRFPCLLAMLLIVVLALSWGPAPGLIATCAGTILLFFFVLPPYLTSSLDGAADLTGMLLFFLVGLAIVVNASQRERARRHAERLSVRLEAVIESIPDAVGIYDMRGTAVQLNRIARRIRDLHHGTGMLANAPHTYNLRRPTGEALSVEELPIVQALRQGEMVSGVEVIYHDVDGHDRDISMSAAPFYNTQGKLEGVVGITYDISSLRQAEREAKAQAKALETIFETIVDGIIVHDSQRRVVRMNSSLRSMFALDGQPELHSRSITEGESLSMLSDGQGRTLSQEQWPISRILKGEKLRGANSVDVIVRNLKGHELEVNISGAPICDEDGNIVGAVSIVHDVTERRQLERRTHEAQRQMEEFLSIASHELRTPLTTIRTGIQLAQRWAKDIVASHGNDTNDGKLDAMSKLLERADRQVGILNRLISDLLDASRIQANKLSIRMTPCDLITIVCDAVDEQRQVVGNRAILLHIAERCEKVPIQADAERIAQVVKNYLTNALKYSALDHPVAVHINLVEEGLSVRVAVRDEGPGLSAEEQKHIWERFYQIERIKVQRGFSVGLGLGLYISRTIIEHHHGQVGVESILGQGSIFWFTLPLRTTPEL